MIGDAGRDAMARLAVPVGDRDHVQGPATASVTLVEYGDYGANGVTVSYYTRSPAIHRIAHPARSGAV